jgi:hypothetical protein
MFESVVHAELKFLPWNQRKQRIQPIICRGNFYRDNLETAEKYSGISAQIVQTTV